MIISFQIDKSTIDEDVVDIGDGCKMEIYISQRRSCESKLYLEMKNFLLISENDYLNQEPTFIFDTTEEKPINGFIATIDLTNPFTSDTYKIEILNSNRYFHFIDDMSVVVPDPPARTELDHGFEMPYYVPYEDIIPSTPLVEETIFNIRNNEVIIVLAQPLDFRVFRESKISYRITGKLSDGSTLSSTGMLLIRIKDYNNNWPNPLETIFIWDGLESALSTDPLAIGATDEDETVNADLEYFIGEIEKPGNEEFYKEVQELYLYEDEMLDYNITVHIIDKGIPRLGRTTSVKVSLSASCINDIDFEIDNTTGNFYVIAAGYYSAGNKKYCDPCEAGYYCHGYGSRAKCTTCDQELLQPDGSYLVTENDLDCQRSKTEFSFGGASECIACKDGWMCSDGIAMPILDSSLYIESCTAGSCPQPEPCPRGAVCSYGIKYDCEPGTTGNGDKCSFCPPGTFSEEVNSVECQCCPHGFESSHKKNKCIPCAFNEISHGCQQCVPCSNSEECPCLNTSPCYIGVQCVNDPSSVDQFVCLQCPEGTEGDGRLCTDINECQVEEACFQSCNNMENGYECDPCPLGYSGETPSGCYVLDIISHVIVGGWGRCFRQCFLYCN